jgi:gliding motility-associated-like protein
LPAYKIDTIYYEGFRFKASGRGIIINPTSAYQENVEPPNSPLPLAYNYIAEDETQANSLFVQSSTPISLYGYNAGSMSSDAASILPYEVLGDEYYTISYNSSASIPITPEEFLIVATQDNTLVTIVPKGNTTKANFSNAYCTISGTTCYMYPPPDNTLTYSTKSKDAGNPFTIRLNKGNTYLMKAQLSGATSINNTYNNNLTGSYIKATNPIAVFAGHRRASITSVGNATRDNLYEQLLPIELWGTEYIAVNTTQFNQLPSNNYHNRVRILASSDNTSVRVVNGSGAVTNYTINRGNYQEFQLTKTQRYATITASAPISVGLFEESSPSGGAMIAGTGDPFLMMLSPISNGVSHTTFSPFPLFALTEDAGNHHYVTIISDTAYKRYTTLVMQGNLVRDTLPLQWVDMNNGYAYATKEVTLQSAYNYYINNPYGVTSFAFGHGAAESYGYLLGMTYTTISDVAVSDSTFCNGEYSNYLPAMHDDGIRGIWYYNSIADWEAGITQDPPAIDAAKDTSYRILYSLAQHCCPDKSDACKMFYPYPREVKIRILAEPQITFDDDTICLAAPANYHAMPAGGVYTYVDRGVEKTFDHRIAGIGRHRVKYTYTHISHADTIPGGTKACKFSKEAWIQVQTPAPVLTAGMNKFCYGDSVILLASGNGIDSIVWRFNDTMDLTSMMAGSISRYVVKPNSPKYESGRYAAYAYDVCGCYTAADTPVNIVIAPPPAVIKPDTPLSYCVGDTLNLYDDLLRIVPYQWYRMGATLSADTLSQYTSKETMPGTYRYILAAGTAIAGRTRSQWCWSRDTTQVSVHPLPVMYQININKPQNSFCSSGDSMLLKAYIGAGSVAAAQYIWTYDNQYLPPSVLANTTDSLWTKNAGIYKVYAMSAHGCAGNSVQKTIEVKNSPQAPVIIAGSQSCQDSAQTLSIAAAPGETYNWCSADSIVIPTAPAASQYRVYAAGTYLARASITYSDGLVCRAYSAPYNVSKYPKPLPPIIINDSISDSNCYARPITLHARMPAANTTAVSSYVWYNADTMIFPYQTDSVIHISRRGAGVYKVKAYSVHGCESVLSSPRSILIDPPEDIVISPNSASFCQGGAVTMTASVNAAEFTYQWYKNNTPISGATQPSYSAANDTARTAAYSYRIAVNIPRCTNPFYSNTASVNVRQVPPKPVINNGKTDTAVCAGMDFTMQAASAGSLRYYWYKNGALDTIIDNTAQYTLHDVQSSDMGNYAVETENSWAQTLSNCRSERSAAMHLDVSPSPNVLFTAFGACSNDTLFNAVLPQGGVFTCSHGCENPARFNPSTSLASRMVTYTYTDANGCAASQSKTITITPQPPVPVITTMDNTQYCAGASISTLLEYNAGAGYTLQWLRNGAVIADAVMSAFRASSAGTYSMTARNGACPAADTSNKIVIGYYPVQPAPVIMPNNPIFCKNGEVKIAVEHANGGVYQWRQNDAVIQGEIDSIYMVKTAGMYSVRHFDANGCWTDFSTPVSAYQYPAVNPYFTDTAVCVSEMRFDAVTPRGGTFSCILGCENAEYFNPRTAIHDTYVTYTTSGVCAESTTRIIRVHDVPLVPQPSSQNRIVCPEGELAIELKGNSNANYTFQWYKDGAPIEGAVSMNYYARSKGDYALLAANGRCSGTMSNAIVIDEYPRSEPPVVQPADTGICPDDAVRLYSAKPSQGYFQWVKMVNGMPQNIDGAMDISYLATEAGDYAARWMDEHGCLTAVGNTAHVEAYSLPDMPQIIAPTSQYYYGMDYTLKLLNIKQGVRYDWFRDGMAAGITSAEFFIKRLSDRDIASYVVSAVNSYGCHILSDEYKIPSAAHLFFIPNIFTPNGDGINDYFEIVGLDAFVENQLKILNKHGVIIYACDNYANDWDGGGMPSDVYFYNLVVKDKDGNSRTHNGFVHLKR